VSALAKPEEIGDYTVHPVAAMFPIIEEGTPAWVELLGSIQQLGQLEPIVVDGKVLIDGRNRLRACQKLGVVPFTVEWSSLDILINQGEWIGAKNLERRHLTDDQRAAITVKVMAWVASNEAEEEKKKTQFKKGESGNPTGKPKEQVSQSSGSPARDHKDKHARSTAGKVAAQAGVSRHKAEKALKVQKADPDFFDKVVNGTAKLSEAGKAIKPAVGTVEDEFYHRKIRGRRRKLNYSTLLEVWQGTPLSARRKFCTWLREHKRQYISEWAELTMIIEEDEPAKPKSIFRNEKAPLSSGA
jgi:ParB-like chromosome segregation protein Spo0J